MRTVTNINKGWLFSKKAKSAPETLPSDFEPVDLPHTWNGSDGQDGGNDYYREKCYYARSLDKSLFTGEVNYLEFKGVNSSAEVYFNGVLLGSHDGGYSAFRIKLPDINDENLLVVSADNSPNERVYPQVADFTFYGGIYRDVNIISVSRNHFDLEYCGALGIAVTPQMNGSDASVTVEAYIGEADGCETVFEIYDGEKLIDTKSTDSKNPKAEFIIKDARLWDGAKDPHLYTAKAILKNNGEAEDELSADFGCRSFSIDPEKGFILNGRPYPLRGVARHQDRPEKGNAISLADHEEDIDLICEMGANTVRLAHYQHDEAFYSLCDRRGLIVWAEIPYISRHMPDGTENTLSQMKELICQNYNHPSIVVWGLSNEITMNGASDSSLLENHRKLNDLAHSLDKTRLTTIAILSMCAPSEEYTQIPDVISYNHYFGWYGGNVAMNGVWFDDFHKKYPNRCVGLSEYGCEALNWHTSEPEQGDYTEEYQAYYHEEMIKQIADRPYLWATHVWNMFDFAADARSEGGENGMNHKGLVTFDRKYKKDSFYAYKAWLSEEPFVHICSKRYIDRVEDKTRVTVYTNLPQVELFANGVSVGKMQRGKYPFYHFEVENKGETRLTAKAGDCSDESVIRKTDSFNTDYIMKEQGAVINWFEIETPAGYFSVNDTIGDVLSTFKGKIFALKMLRIIKKTLGGSKEGGAMSAAGFKLNRTMLDMAKGFTIKRAFMMLGGKFTKEQILEINAMLNKIKKKK